MSEQHEHQPESDLAPLEPPAYTPAPAPPVMSEPGRAEPFTTGPAMTGPVATEAPPARGPGGPAREASAVAVASRIVLMVAAVVVTVAVLFIAVQQRHQTQLLRRQGCLQQTAYIRALEPTTDSAQQLLTKQTAQVRACVGIKP